MGLKVVCFLTLAITNTLSNTLTEEQFEQIRTITFEQSNNNDQQNEICSRNN